MKQSKVDLFKKAKNGSIKAYEKLTEEYQKKIYALALSIYKNKTQANELTQQVFIEVFKDLSSINGEGALLSSIYRTTASLCMDKQAHG